jgi:hypothetical protein
MLLIPETVPTIKHRPVEVEGFFLAFGTITFAFCGHTVFPTIQHDMLDRSKFWYAVIFGYAGNPQLPDKYNLFKLLVTFGRPKPPNFLNHGAVIVAQR